MWHIFIDKSDNQYLVLHFNDRNKSDFLLRSNLDCWTNSILDYSEINVDDSPEHIDAYSRLSIIHSFESDDPISYIHSLPQIHPELFI